MKNIFKTIPIFGAFIIFLSFANISYAASVYLTPGSKTVYQGVNFSVAVRMNSGGELVNAVQANLSYPSDTIDFVGIGSGGSAFSIAAPSGGGSGGVSISRGVLGGGVSGDRLIATVTFRPKKGATGAASIGISGGTALVRGSDQANIYSGGTGGSYTIAAASLAPSSSPSSGVPSGSIVAPLKISDVKAVNISLNSATITWTTNREVTSIVEFGLTENYGLTSEESNLSANHSVSLSPDFLTPGSTYHYRIKSIDNKEQEATSSDSTFTIPGITLRVEVQDVNGLIITNREVSLVTPGGVKTAMTDANGVATFNDLAPVTYTILVGEKASVVAVKAPTQEELLQKSLPVQNAIIKVAGASYYNLSPELLAGIIIAILLGLLIVVFMWRKFRKPYRQTVAPPQNGPPSIPNIG